MCGINASVSQWCGYIFILCYTHLKLALLLHKQGLVATGVATTVVIISNFRRQDIYVPQGRGVGHRSESAVNKIRTWGGGGC